MKTFKEELEEYFIWYDSLSHFYKELYREEYIAVLLEMESIVNNLKGDKE